MYPQRRPIVGNSNPFRVRDDSFEHEILPDKSIGNQPQPRPQLKMTVPKSILKSSQELAKNMALPKHVNFDSYETEQADTFRDPSKESTSDQVQPLFTDRSDLSDITSLPQEIQKVLKRFLKGPWELDYNQEDFLYDKVLLEFPIFSLNDDYLRAIANIVFMKIE